MSDNNTKQWLKKYRCIAKNISSVKFLKQAGVSSRKKLTIDGKGDKTVIQDERVTNMFVCIMCSQSALTSNLAEVS